MFPNPTSGPLFIDVPENGRLEVLDVSGRIMLSRIVASGRLELGIEGLSAGLYHLKLQADHLYTTRILRN
ncbi:MAG: T9SS type A sorting domain-containing protein [Flavobacteriales bacterium]|nr:T9SS type A sorting domain-containing protein [Flavobacteriales bacterium]